MLAEEGEGLETSHRLVARLLHRVLESVEGARQEGVIEEHLVNAVMMIQALQSGLDLEYGGSVAAHLDDFYSEMSGHLQWSIQEDDLSRVEIVSDKISGVYDAWVRIPNEFQSATREELLEWSIK